MVFHNLWANPYQNYNQKQTYAVYRFNAFKWVCMWKLLTDHKSNYIRFGSKYTQTSHCLTLRFEKMCPEKFGKLSENDNFYVNRYIVLLYEKNNRLTSAVADLDDLGPESSKACQNTNMLRSEIILGLESRRK